MNIHKNARLTPLRREEMALAVIEGGLSQAQAALKYRGDAEGRGALGGALQGRGPRRHGRPLVAAETQPERRRPGRGRAHRRAAAPALHRPSTSQVWSASLPATVSRVLERGPDCRG